MEGFSNELKHEGMADLNTYSSEATAEQNIHTNNEKGQQADDKKDEKLCRMRKTWFWAIIRA
jgi:hypothetical protein